VTNVKTFIGTLLVTNPVRQSRASSRKRVLRRGGQPPLRSVDSQIKRCAIEPRNFLVVSLRLGQMRGPRQAAYTWTHRARLVTRRSKNMANDHEGSPGTWETLPSPSKCRLETRLTNSRLIQGSASRAAGDERGTQRWYRQAKETKCGETDLRESQHLIVQCGSGGTDPPGPRRAKGVSRRGLGAGTTPRRRRASSACHREANGSC